MKTATLSLGILLACSSLAHSLAQDLPKSQPKFLTIYREHVKLGKASEHSKFEAGYPAALEKAKSPDYYIALSSITGSREVWYVQSNDSLSAIGESIKREDKDPVLSAEMARLAAGDAEYIDSSSVIRAMGRPDLSVGTFPEISKARFFSVSTFRIRPGKETQFEEMSRVYGSVMTRGATNASYRIYEVIAGDRVPTYLIFSSAESYGDFDQHISDGEKAFKGASAGELATLAKFSEVAESIEVNHFQLDPVQSYVSKEVRTKDAEFWIPKSAGTP